MRVAIGAHKGGVGKTTTAVMLALLLGRSGPTVLVDADRQGSAKYWRDVALDEGQPWPSSVELVRWADPMTLPPRDLAHVVIDTGPNDPERLRAALSLVDLAVIPVGARAADVIQLGDTIADVERVAQNHALTWGVLLTMRDGRIREVTSTDPKYGALAAMARDDVPAMTTAIPYGALYRRAFGTVPTHYGAYRDLLDELEAATPTAQEAHA